jgi:hypothetical protein
MSRDLYLLGLKWKQQGGDAQLEHMGVSHTRNCLSTLAFAKIHTVISYIQYNLMTASQKGM